MKIAYKADGHDNCFKGMSWKLVVPLDSYHFFFFVEIII